MVGILSGLRRQARQSEMPFRLLQSQMSLFHELQRVRHVIGMKAAATRFSLRLISLWPTPSPRNRWVVIPNAGYRMRGLFDRIAAAF